MRGSALAGLVVLLSVLLAACSMVPNMDDVGSGCANRVGAGPRNQSGDPEGVPLAGIAGLRPEEAAAAAAETGHAIVFRLHNLACVCIPPTGYGPIIDGWWGERGQLYVDLENVTPQGQRLPDGTGC